MFIYNGCHKVHNCRESTSLSLPTAVTLFSAVLPSMIGMPTLLIGKATCRHYQERDPTIVTCEAVK